MKIEETTMQGNYGELLVSHILSRFCLVRPVVGNTDIGVDLYCESIIDSKPFLHFWVQVKTYKDFLNEPGEVSVSFKKSSLQYWNRQPVPVLAFLVPSGWPPRKIDYINVVDITFDLLEHGINNKDTKSQTLKSKPQLALCVSDDKKLNEQLNRMLIDHLPMAVSAIYAEKGFVCEAPKPKEEYTKYFAGHFLSRNIDLIGKRMRHAVTFGIMQYISNGNDVNGIPKIFLAALEAMHDDDHYEVHESLGMVYHQKNENNKALASFQKAIFHINDNPNIDHSIRPWSENIERINQRIKLLQNQL